jgi:hypothetical protein
MAINYKLVTATSDASSPDTVFTATAVATHVKSIRIANESGGTLTYHLAVYDHSTSTEVLLTVPATSLPDDDVDLMVEPINLQNNDYIKLYSSGAGVKVALTLAENTDTAGATTSDDLAQGTTNLYLTSAERTKLTGIATGAEVNQNAFSNIAVSGQTTVAADAKTDTFTLVAGTGVTLTTDAGADSITIAASGSSSNSFETIAVAGQSSVVADSATDTLTLVAGTGITITTDAGADSVTITNSATGANAFGNVAVSGQTTVAEDSTNDTLTLAAANSNVVLTTDATTDTVTVGLGTDLVVGSVTATTGNLTTLANVSCVDVISSGSANLTNAVISTSLTVTSISFTGGGTTTLGPNNTLPTDPSDFLIRSNGNVDIVLDYDDDESSQAFRVKDGDNNTMFSVDEDGISVANGTSSTGAVIRLGEATANGTNYVGIQAPASLAANTTWILPSADGTSAQVLQTNGSGTLSFVSLLTTAATTTAGAILELREGTNNGTNYVRIQAPASLAADVTYTLPTADGTSGQVLTTNGSGTLSWATDATGGSGSSYSAVRTQSGTTYTLVLGDAGDYIQTTSTTAVTITVPTQASVTWAADTEIYFEQNNTGQITIAGASGVTVNSSETLKSFARYSVIALKRVAENVWTLTGERALV